MGPHQGRRRRGEKVSVGGRAGGQEKDESCRATVG